MHHHTQLIFVLLVETDFHHVGQAGLELGTSGDPPTLISQSAGITDVSCTQPDFEFCLSFAHKKFPFWQITREDCGFSFIFVATLFRNKTGSRLA